MREDVVNETAAYFCPFGSLDIGTAARVALDVEEPLSYVYDCVEAYAYQTDMKISDCDPVWCIYEEILQLARNEIEAETGFDFQNDGDTGIDVSGNFMATAYDWKDTSALEEAISGFDITEWSIKTQWFLGKLEIVSTPHKKKENIC